MHLHGESVYLFGRISRVHLLSNTYSYSWMVSIMYILEELYTKDMDGKRKGERNLILEGKWIKSVIFW